MIASNPNLFDALASAPVLAGLSGPALALLAREGVVKNFKTGDLIVREGEPGHSLFVLAEGRVEVVKHLGEAHEATLAQLPERAIFGELCVIDPVPRAATVRALTAVQVIEIQAATLYHLYQKIPDQYAVVILNIARDVARRLRALDEVFSAHS